MNDAASKRRRIKELEVMVAEVVPETADTTTLVLFTGNDRLDYEAGHFLTIDPHQFPALQRFVAYFEDTKGKKEPPRAYSLASAPHEKRLAITVKEERYVSGSTRYPPLLSPLLVRHLERGAHLMVTGFTGPYTLSAERAQQTDHVVHLCAGSGIVPNYALMKHALVTYPSLRHTLVYSNRARGEIIFDRQLAALEREHPDRVRIFHALTRDPAAAQLGGHVRSGRVSLELLREAIPDPKACVVFACGPAVGLHERKAAKELGQTPPPRFMESVTALLTELGVPDENLHAESYG